MRVVRAGRSFWVVLHAEQREVCGGDFEAVLSLGRREFSSTSALREGLGRSTATVVGCGR